MTRYVFCCAMPNKLGFEIDQAVPAPHGTYEVTVTCVTATHDRKVRAFLKREGYDLMQVVDGYHHYA